MHYHKSEKSAYDILRDDIKIDAFESRKILKEIKNYIYIPQPINIVPNAEMEGPAATINKIKLKGNFSSTYYRYSFQSF
jgi:hypothetical protein